MSDVVKPPIHGRDHRPGGSDPIPFLHSYESGIANDGAISGTGTVSNNTLTQINFADGTSVSGSAKAIFDNSGGSTSLPLQLKLDGWYMFYLDVEWSGGAFTDTRYYAVHLQFNADNDGNLYLGANESAPKDASFHRTWGPMYLRATSLKPKLSAYIWHQAGSTQTLTGVLLTVVYLGADTDPGRFPPF